MSETQHTHMSPDQERDAIEAWLENATLDSTAPGWMIDHLLDRAHRAEVRLRRAERSLAEARAELDTAQAERAALAARVMPHGYAGDGSAESIIAAADADGRGLDEELASWALERWDAWAMRFLGLTGPVDTHGRVRMREKIERMREWVEAAMANVPHDECCSGDDDDCGCWRADMRAAISGAGPSSDAPAASDRVLDIVRSERDAARQLAQQMADVADGLRHELSLVRSALEGQGVDFTEYDPDHDSLAQGVRWLGNKLRGEAEKWRTTCEGYRRSLARTYCVITGKPWHDGVEPGKVYLDAQKVVERMEQAEREAQKVEVVA